MKKKPPVTGEEAHPLLGVRHVSASGETSYSQKLSVAEQPWLVDHQVFDGVVAPGAQYLSIAVSVAGLPCRLRDVSILQALVLDEHESSLELQLVVKLAEEDGRQFELFSREDTRQQAWTLHARGRVEEGAGGAVGESCDSLEALWDRLAEQPVEGFYDALAELGILYGPAFQGVERLWTGEEGALGKIITPAELKTSGSPIHPAVLDACLQVSGAAGGEPDSNSDVYVPFEVQELQLRQEVPEQFYCYARQRDAEGDNRRETLVSDLWLLDEDGQLLGSIEGLVAKRATRQTMLGGGREKIEDWLYEVEWREQPQAREVIAADFWPSPESLAVTTAPRAEEFMQEVEWSGDDRRLGAELEKLSQEYIQRALTKLGWSPVVGQQATVDELMDRLGIDPRHRKLTGRMLEVLAGGGRLKREDTGWRVVDRLELEADPSERREELLERFPRGQVELTLLGRCGEQLAGVLSGRVDPLSLLFPQEGIRAEDLYRDAPGAKVFNRLVQQSLAAALEQLPAGRPLRVLEIGAGTGGTTGYVLPVLPGERTEYIYTDISPGFFAAAEERFSEYPFVKYQRLDIEQSPSQQGFTAHQFDVVLAANVLHATRDIEATMAHVRELLAPAGLLVLLEGLQRQAWLDLTFGAAGWLVAV